MDLLIYRPANTNEKQPITHLKPWISANPTDTREKVKNRIALFFCFSTQIYVIYAERPSAGVSELFCPRAKLGNTEHVEGRTSYVMSLFRGM